MCGIVGLFLKDQALQPKLGALLADMCASTALTLAMSGLRDASTRIFVAVSSAL